MRRIVSVLTVLVLALALLAGCTTPVLNTGKRTKLRYLMPGPGMQEDSSLVWSEFNSRLQEKLPNVEVAFEIIPLAEYAQKFMLMQASREPMDIVNQYGLNLGNEITNGTFAELDGLLKDYGQELTAALPDWLFEYMTVNGKTYGIPSYQMCGAYRCFVFIKEYADKYLDMEAFKNALYASNILTNDVYDVLEQYLAALKADGVKFKTAPWINVKGYENVLGDYVVKKGDPSCTVYNYRISDELKDYYARMRSWYEKGYIREDALTAKDTMDFRGKMDGLPFWDEGYTPYVQENLSKQYGIELLTVPYEDQYHIDMKNSAAGTGIPASSKNKEAAMQVLNLLQSDRELYNLLVFGIEGKHYTKTGGDRIETVAPNGQATANDKYGLYKWIVGNTELAYNHQHEPEGYKKWVFEEVNTSAYRSPLIGFIPETSKISNYVTQIDGIKGEYGGVSSGALENWEQSLAEWRAKVKLVGDEEIVKELQRQIDEFLKNKN